jgi:hypothetical protein
MMEWTKSSIDRKVFDGLQEIGLIPDATVMLGWRVPATTGVEPRPQHNEVVSFTHFHYFGFGLPAHLLTVVNNYYIPSIKHR